MRRKRRYVFAAGEGFGLPYPQPPGPRKTAPQALYCASLADAWEQLAGRLRQESLGTDFGFEYDFPGVIRGDMADDSGIRGVLAMMECI